jgi:transcriptional regulator with XRE-family HTH domain
MNTSGRATLLHDWRLAHGLTLRELAGLTGFSDAYVSRLERGERHLRPLARVRFARALGAQVKELFEAEAGDGS